MTSTTSIPATIQLKPRRLVGLLLAAVALAAAVTWAVAVLAIDSRTDNDQSAPSAAVTPQQITAAYPDVFGSTGVGGGAFAPPNRLAGLGGTGAFIPPQG